MFGIVLLFFVFTLVFYTIVGATFGAIWVSFWNSLRGRHGHSLSDRMTDQATKQNSHTPLPPLREGVGGFAVGVNAP